MRFLFERYHNERLGRHLHGECALLELGILVGLRSNYIGMIEVVEVGYVLRGEDATANLLGIETGKVEIDGLILVEAHVGDGQYDATIGCLGC